MIAAKEGITSVRRASECIFIQTSKFGVFKTREGLDLARIRRRHARAHTLRHHHPPIVALAPCLGSVVKLERLPCPTLLAALYPCRPRLPRNPLQRNTFCQQSPKRLHK